MKVVLHGQLADRFGREFFIDCAVAAEAIEGLSSQLPDWPRNMVIDVVGFDDEVALRSPTDAEEIHLIPAMYGGQGKFGTIILGAALIGVALMSGPLHLGLSAALKTSLIVSGAIMAAQGVVTLFMKAPSLSKENDPAPSKYLGSGKNTTAAGTPIPNAWGRVQLSPHWLSVQSDSDNLAFGTFPETLS